MTPFLRQVAAHYCSESMEDKCFVFPNRRALVFFKKYLSEEIAARCSSPLIAPGMFTVNDFFYRAAGAVQTDRVRLLKELYECYSALNPKAEPLDDFIFWGDVILSDFDDVDKYMVDAKGLFANVSDFKQMQDSFSYLTENQEEAIRRFLCHFESTDRVKDSFLQVWQILAPLYVKFNSVLSEKGMTYEGKVYRSLASRLDSEGVVVILSEHFPGAHKFVFVGLNAPGECEKRMMRAMRNARIAEFCWDYSSSEIKAPDNKSSFFMDTNVREFPQAFDLDPEGLPKPKIHTLSVPSNIGQAKQIPAILERLGPGAGTIRTAIVLPEENLLIPVLNSIPSDIEELNVTMGYPMSASELWDLCRDVASMQMNLRKKDGGCLFYHRQVWAIFSNSVFKNAISDKGRQIVAAVRKSAKYYIPREDLQGDPIMDLIFRPVEDVPSIEDYQQAFVSAVALAIKDKPDMAVELDFARKFHMAVGRLRECELPIGPAVYYRLLSQIMSGTSVPFLGEPLKGLQIMGPLETRALDFDNVIVLSCNEGVFPRRSTGSSFIPSELRKGFGLPTYEYQDAVWAYYFYRMIQRASNVWLVYDSSAEGLRGGEESRYIKQLAMHFGIRLEKYVVKAPLGNYDVDSSIEKTDEHIARLHERPLSASALQSYLTCPAKFYYRAVCHLKEENEVSESLDAGMLGDVFHKTMQVLYGGRPSVSRKYIDSLLGNRDRVKDVVSGLIKDSLHTTEIRGRNIIFEDVVVQYVIKVLQRDRELLGKYSVDEFKIEGLELKRTMKIGDYQFIGYIDRLDSFEEGTVRVVDYKTGRVSDNDFIINGANAETVVRKLFGPKEKERPKIALQLYLYDRFVSSDGKHGELRILNSIYQTSRLFVKEVEEVELNGKFCDLMRERIDSMLSEISDTSVPWNRTCDENVCAKCEFKMICGK